mgnify:FL=1
MRDPYQVLGVPSTATDEEVKKAYRNLARKYHPANYHDNPLADLAQERMKEINEAYEEIQTQRKRGASAGSYGTSSGYTGGASYGYGGYGGYQSYAGPYQRVRMAILQNDLNLAEELLNAMQNHDAEWNFLKGVLCQKRGWMDEARRYYQTAVQMDPDNSEYQQALDRAEGRQTTYRPDGYGSASTGNCQMNPCLPFCLPLFCCPGGGYLYCC